jgi:hypothetical protein
VSEGAASGDGQAAARWKAEVARLHDLTDPEVDQAIEDYQAARPELTDVRAVVVGVIEDLAEAKAQGEAYVGPLRGLSNIERPLPPWGHDNALLRRGQAVFNDRGLDMAAALVFASLPLAYASRHAAEALFKTSDLATKNLSRRIGETGQMLIDVMGTRDGNTLAPGGRGYATAIGLRLLHGCVRSLLLGARSPEWPADKLGPPLNQEMLLATLMDFTLVTWEAVARWGDTLSDEDRRAHLYTWSIVGHLMGVEACRNGPLLLTDVDALSPQLSRQLGASAGGPVLMTALLGELERFMPLGWRKLPRSVVHWMFRDGPHGTNEVPRLLEVPAPAWWSRPLFSVLVWAKRTPWLAPIRIPLAWVVRRSGRLIVVGLADGFASESPPFRIPEPLARSWRVRTGPTARRVRAARHRARTRVRAVGPLRRRSLRPA